MFIREQQPHVHIVCAYMMCVYVCERVSPMRKCVCDDVQLHATVVHVVDLQSFPHDSNPLCVMHFPLVRLHVRALSAQLAACVFERVWCATQTGYYS